MSNETVLYEGKPSQLVNIKTFTICLAMFLFSVFSSTLWDDIFSTYLSNKSLYTNIAKGAFFVSIVWSFYTWLQVKEHTYKITSERFVEIEGIIARATHEIELFRVKDFTLVEPIALRMVGCGNVVLDTSDKSTPVVVMHGIKDARKVMDILRQRVIQMRQEKGVREID